MIETLNLTSEQKEVNKNYILANLDKYVVDVKGNFFHTEKELGSDYWYIGSEAVNDYWNVIEEFVKKILKDKKDWEIWFFYEGGSMPKGIRHRVSGEKIDTLGFGYENQYYLLGELGFRGNSWNDYDSPNSIIKEIFLKTRKKRLEKERGQSETNSFQSQQSEQDETEVEQLKKQFKEELKKAQEQSKDNSPNQNSEPQNQEIPTNLLSNQSKQDQQTEPINNNSANNNNNEESNSPNQQQPTINDKDSTNDKKDATETQSQVKTQITQTLKKHNLKITDLPKKYHNWEEQLTKLTTKEQINSLVSEINQQIENKLKELKNQKGNNNQSSSQPLSLTTKLLIGGVMAGLITVLTITFLIARKRRISKIKH